jgi:hypothetical protein
MTAEEDDSTEEHWLTSERPADWLATDNERVYLRDEVVAYHPSAPTDELVKAGAIVAEALPGEWTVVITGGFVRGYDIRYVAEFERQRINLDVWFRRPGFQHLGDLIAEVKRKSDDSSDGETGVSA